MLINRVHATVASPAPWGVQTRKLRECLFTTTIGILANAPDAVDSTAMKLGRIATLLVAMFVGILVGGFGPQLLRSKLTKNYPASLEQVRKSSPDERFDAVMIREMYGGAMGGIDWYVYLVPKGKAVSRGLRPLLKAGSFDGTDLAWQQAHLLEIPYSKGLIEQFRNLWCLDEIENVGPTGGHDYCVEIRLAPSSSFSILNPSGGFR